MGISDQVPWVEYTRVWMPSDLVIGQRGIQEVEDSA